jgi:DNA polymerase-1
MIIKISAFDTETTGLNPFKDAKIFAWSTCDINGKVDIYRDKKYSISTTNKKIIYYEGKELLQKYLNNTTIHKVCHNFHFDYLMCLMCGYKIPDNTVWHCTYIMFKLINNLIGNYGLDELAYSFGNYKLDQDVTISQAAKIYKGYDKIPQHLMYKYQYADAERGMLLFRPYFPLIKNMGLTSTYLREIELVKTTVRMEKHGIMLCRPETLKLLDFIDKEMSSVEKESFQLFNKQINLNSGRQIIKILFGDKQQNNCIHCNNSDLYYVNRICKFCGNLTFSDNNFYPVIDFSQKTNEPSVGKNILENLRDYTIKYNIKKETSLLLDLILKKRSYTRSRASINNFIEETDKNGIIHCNINTIQAVTGRESITRPALQTVSKELSLKTKYSIPERKCFRARPRHFLLIVDYSGIEMRIAVQLTNSKRLLKLVQNDFDFHADCAALFYGNRFTNRAISIDYFLKDKPQEKEKLQLAIKDEGEETALNNVFYRIKKMLRSSAKNGRFAMLYGAGIDRVADTLGLTIKETEECYKTDKLLYPEFHLLMNNCIKEIHKRGYIKTLFGKILYVQKDKAYAATDFKIQGSAADLFKQTQIALDCYFKNVWSDTIHLLLPVHDEFITEIPNEYEDQLQTIMVNIYELMTNVDEITVKLDVEFKLSSSTWNEAKPIKLEIK